jgi:membrane-bound lytic murein transglycosylase D
MNIRINNKLFYMLASALTVGAIALFCWGKSPAGCGQPASFRDKYVVRSLELPSQLSFAGEQVPLKQWEVREALDKELLVNTYWQSHTILLLKRASRFFPVIEPVLKKYGVPDDFKYLSVIESDLSNVVSPAQAVGFWQLLKSTATIYGLEISDEVDMRYNVEASTEAACKYLLTSYKRFGSWTMAAASYNAGMTGMSKQMTRQLEKDYYKLLLNDETSRYLFRILAVKLIIENPESYGYKVPEQDRYPVMKHIDFKTDSTINDLVSFAQSHGITYKTLKLYNPWLRDIKLTNKDHKPYVIYLPE